MMSELEQRLIEAREELRKRQNEALRKIDMVLRAYRHYWGKVDRTREEWLGLCEVSKEGRNKHRNHLVGLVLLKERMHDKYRELFLKALGVYLRVCRLKRQLKNLKEVELCAEM